MSVEQTHQGYLAIVGHDVTQRIAGMGRKHPAP